jgi:hypothetical protein
MGDQKPRYPGIIEVSQGQTSPRLHFGVQSKLHTSVSSTGTHTKKWTRQRVFFSIVAHVQTCATVGHLAGISIQIRLTH